MIIPQAESLHEESKKNVIRDELAQIAKRTAKAVAVCALAATTITHAELLGMDGSSVGHKVPAKLPAVVSLQSNRAVHLESIMPRSVLPDFKENSVSQHAATGLSGVNIGDGYYLSAGHALSGDSPQALGKYGCGNVIIHGLTKDNKPYTITPSQATYIDTGELGKDIAIFHVDPLEQFRLTKEGVDMSPMPIAEKYPTPGQNLFFANFQPISDGFMRDPYVADSARRVPAIFAGAAVLTVFGNSTVIGNMRSYGTGAPDIHDRPGASGGEVLNALGQLEGLSNYSTFPDGNSGFWNGLSRAAFFKLGPLGLPGDGTNLMNITDVNPAEIQSLKQEVDAQPICESLPDLGALAMIYTS